MSARAKFFCINAALVVVFDQITKWLAIAHLTDAFSARHGGAEATGFFDQLSRFLWVEHPMRTEVVPVVEGLWNYRYVENPGAAFGFLASSDSWLRTPFFLTVTAVALVFIISMFRQSTLEQKLLRLSLGMIFGGAIGNLIDRGRLGYVIDFIDWHWYDAYTWPTFNIADSAISIGVCFLVLEMIKGDGVVEEETPSSTQGE
tara:strand:- start:477 stop:1082 length:606 start_codon:yes stop_codon:yes gene_type:complete